MTDVLLVAVDRDFAKRVDALGGHRVVIIDRYTAHRGKHAGEATEPNFQPELIFVGSGLPVDQALDYARVVVEDHPEISVVLVAKRSRPLSRRAARVGVDVVVDERIEERSLARLVERAGHADQANPAKQVKPAEQAESAKPSPPIGQATPAAEPPSTAPSYPHQVIVVASPKGGVGKTTMATNMAALLAESAPGEVVLLDLDLQFGDVAAMLDLAPAYTVADAFASGGDDSMRLRTLLLPHPANFYVLCGSDDPAANGRVTGDQIRKLVHHYSSTFRYVVVDTPAGLHEETLASLEEATDVVFVTALDVGTLRAARREFEVLADLSLAPPRQHVVLNRADRRLGLGERDVERIIGLPVDAVVPASEAVPLAANRGELVVAARRHNPARQAMQALTRVVADLSSPKGGI